MYEWANHTIKFLAFCRSIAISICHFFFGLWNETSIRLFPFSLSNSFASAALVVSVCFSFDFSTSWMLFFSAIQIPHRKIFRRNGQEANTDTNIQIRLTSHFHRNFSIVLLFLCVCVFSRCYLYAWFIFCERNFIDVWLCVCVWGNLSSSCYREVDGMEWHLMALTCSSHYIQNKRNFVG